MNLEIVKVNKSSFNDVVTLVHKTLGYSSKGLYTRARATEFVVEKADNMHVLLLNDIVMGAYSYSELPNVYSLNFFALDERVRKKKSGYKLFLDMKRRLIGRPVNVVVYNSNDDMLDVVKKRGTFVGRSLKGVGDPMDFYSIMFENF